VYQCVGKPKLGMHYLNSTDPIQGQTRFRRLASCEAAGSGGHACLSFHIWDEPLFSPQHAGEDQSLIVDASDVSACVRKSPVLINVLRQDVLSSHATAFHEIQPKKEKGKRIELNVNMKTPRFS